MIQVTNQLHLTVQDRQDPKKKTLNLPTGMQMRAQGSLTATKFEGSLQG